MFGTVLHELQVQDTERYSNTAIARAVGVDEKIVREWRSGDRPIPAAALGLLPWEVYARMRAHIEAARAGRIEPRALPQMRPLLAKVAGQLAREDRDVAIQELRAARGEIDDMIIKKAMAG